MESLNARAARLYQELTSQATRLRIESHRLECGATVVDFGIRAAGGLEAGLALARVCLADLARVDFVPGPPDVWSGPAVAVATDHPVAACMASQYAGWQIADGKFFAMGSGPMRAAAGHEVLFERIGLRERPELAVGILETRKLPPNDVALGIAAKCGVAPENLTLLVAPTASPAGTVQVVARSIETALHKLVELGFNVNRVQSGWGIAPVPPPAADDLAAIGRTNDAILYGAHALLWVRGDDDSLTEIGPKVPSCASSVHGSPFAEIFECFGRDFYKIDPLLFSPAMVTFLNMDTGRTHRYGQFAPDVLQRSFGG